MNSDWRTSYRLSYAATLQASGDQIREAWGVEHEMLVVTKSHLRGYIREHGLVDFAGDRVAPQELLPLELHSIQDFNYRVGEFFDRALYHLARGYEAAAREAHPAETFVTT